MLYPLSYQGAVKNAYFNEKAGAWPAFEFGGAEGDRTPDLVIANDALSQLSYGPK